MMHYEVLKGLLITSHLLLATDAIGLDGKLDFGSGHSSTSSLRSENKENKNTFTPFKYSKTIKSNDDFENIGIVCTSGGCNTTETTSSNSEDNIQTDILVHVHTKVDFKHNKNESVEDTPDIPIIVGYGGSQLDATIDDDNSRDLGPQSIFVPDVPEVPTYKSVSSFGSKFNPSTSLTPTIGSRIDSVSSRFDGLDSSSRSNTFYGSNPSPRIDSFGNSFGSLNPSTKTISGFYVTKPSPVASRVDYVSRSFEKLDPAAKTGFFPTRTNSQFDINIKPLSSVSIGASDDGDVKYKENGIEVKIPYFEQAYHNHYYGENPPPQYIWHSKNTNGFNPVEFKTIKSTWTPSVWSKKLVPHRHDTTTSEGEVKCSCKEQQGVSTGLRWYPSADRKTPSFNEPGAQINDKLAPLN